MVLFFNILKRAVPSGLVVFGVTNSGDAENLVAKSCNVSLVTKLAKLGCQRGVVRKCISEFHVAKETLAFATFVRKCISEIHVS